MKKITSMMIMVGLALVGCIGLQSGTGTSSTASGNLPAITLEPVNSSQLPPLQQYIGVSDNNRWLIMGGLTSGIHRLNLQFANDSIYVFDTNINKLYSIKLSDTDLPPAVVQQLLSVFPVPYRDNSTNTEYLIGGFFENNPANSTFITLNTITSFDIPGIINAIVNNQTNLAQYVHYSNAYPQFQVTGGGLNKIGNVFYLVFGQICTGDEECSVSQQYTNTIYPFTTDPTLRNVNFGESVSTTDNSGSGFRRRDYDLVPLANTGGLIAMAAGSQPGVNPDVITPPWTNVIGINANNGGVQYDNNWMIQQANQYNNAFISMYDATRTTSYVATFAGLSDLYWDQNNNLVYTSATPYGNILDMISYKTSGAKQEYVNSTPVYNTTSQQNVPLYMGLGTGFLKAGNYYDNNDVLHLENMRGKTLVGYLYGGVISSSQDIFHQNNSAATNQVYAVYVTPNVGDKSWINVTNKFVTTGNGK